MSDAKKFLFFSKQDGFHEAELPASFAARYAAEAAKEPDAWHDRMDGLGFEPAWTYGDLSEATDWAKGWRNTKKDGPRFLVEIHDVESSDDVFVEDQASFMTLRLKLARSMAATAAGYDLRELNEMVRRLFLVYHGHDVADSCKKCDPDERGVKQ